MEISDQVIPVHPYDKDYRLYIDYRLHKEVIVNDDVNHIRNNFQQEQKDQPEKKEKEKGKKAMLISIRNNSRQEKKEIIQQIESAEAAAIREETLRAWNEMQEMINPTNKDKSVRIQEMVAF